MKSFRTILLLKTSLYIALSCLWVWVCIALMAYLNEGSLASVNSIALDMLSYVLSICGLLLGTFGMVFLFTKITNLWTKE